MTRSDGEQVLDYPLVRQAALDPPAEWAELRQQCPIARVKLPSGDEAALLTRYDDVKQVLSEPDLAIATEDLRRVEELIVGRLTKLSVWW